MESQHDRHHDSCPQCNNQKRTVAKLCRLCSDKQNHRGVWGVTKICAACGEEKPLSAYRIRHQNDPRPRPRCKPCEADDQRRRFKAPHRKERRNVVRREWAKNNPVAYQGQQNRRKFRAKGIEPTPDLLLRLESQKTCDICGEEAERYLHIDHDHDSGAFRGLLCGRCNVGLGHFLHEPWRLQKAKEYLQLTSSPDEE